MRDLGPSADAGKPVHPYEAIMEASDECLDYVLRFEAPAKRVAHQAAVTPVRPRLAKEPSHLRLAALEFGLEAEEAGPPAIALSPRRSRRLLLVLGFGFVCLAAVAAVCWLAVGNESEVLEQDARYFTHGCQWVLPVRAPDGVPGNEPVGELQAGPALIPFGDIEVNLNDGQQRRLRLKITLVGSWDDAPLIREKTQKQRAVLKNWLLTHICDFTVAEVQGAAGVSLLQGEIKDQFNHSLFPDGPGKIEDVLFEEFVLR
jgi:flagellar basal body-associated protein FliL